MEATPDELARSLSCEGQRVIARDLESTHKLGIEVRPGGGVIRSALCQPIGTRGEPTPPMCAFPRHTSLARAMQNAETLTVSQRSNTKGKPMLRASWPASHDADSTLVIKRISFAVVLSLLASASPLLAADSEPGKETIATVQVAVDPSTGRLAAPTPEQRAKLAAALAQMVDQRTEGLEVRRLPNGMHLVDLQGRFQNVEVAVRGTDGEVRLQCIDGPYELDWVLDRRSKPSPAPRPATEER